MHKRWSWLAASALLACGQLASAEVPPFPPVTPEERDLLSVQGEPNAPAVVLSRKAELLMFGYGTDGRSVSRLRVSTRLKILTEEGRRYAEVLVPHSRRLRLENLMGRTVDPGGVVASLPPSARFERQLSTRRRQFVTALAYPKVQVGTILDLYYELAYKDTILLDPWYFSDEIPVRRSEIVFKVPPEVEVQPWHRDPLGAGIQSETVQVKHGAEIRVWAENLPAVAEDPFGLPFADMATQVMLLPTFYRDGTHSRRLMGNWATTASLMEEGYYKPARQKDSGVAGQARSLTGGARDSRERIEALYRFVRDEITTDPGADVSLPEGSSIQAVLSKRRGERAEKALLLQALLRAAEVDARLVWAADRSFGRVDSKLANPDWFDTVLVAVEVDGKRVYLDSSDRSLAFGRLQPGHEGTTAVVLSRDPIKDPRGTETTVLPESPADLNSRRASVDLALEPDGRLAGKAELVLSGHAAWEKRGSSDPQGLDAWKESLGKTYRGFRVEDVRVVESDGEVRVAWSLRQSEEEALGDEALLTPSLPLGPAAQPFVQDASARRSPVLFPFGYREEVELKLRWPEGWDLEAQPGPIQLQGKVGALEVSVGSIGSGGERTLTYRRRLVVSQRELETKAEYEEARALLGAAEKSDAQALVLARR